VRPLCVLPELPYAHPSLNHLRISLGHFKLWKLGFEHRDPSLGNLMTDPTSGRGVLNDWDLSHHAGLPKSVQHHWGITGTIPFMAVDLLCASNWRGRKPRLYRHDLEGLIWILPWVFLQYDGSTFKTAKLRKWSTGDYQMCGDEKRRYLRDTEQHAPMKSWKPYWPVAETLLTWTSAEHIRRDWVSVSKSRWLGPDVAKEAQRATGVADDATHDSVHARPLVYASQQAPAQEFSSASGHDQDVGASVMEAMVAGYFMDEHSSGDDDLPVSELADRIDDIAEPPPEEVYEKFCRALWVYEPIRPAMQILHMQPADIW